MYYKRRWGRFYDSMRGTVVWYESALSVWCIEKYAIAGKLRGNITLEKTRTKYFCHHHRVLPSDIILCRSIGLLAGRRDVYKQGWSEPESLRKETLFVVLEAMLVRPKDWEKHWVESLRNVPARRIDPWCGASCTEPVVCDNDGRKLQI